MRFSTTTLLALAAPLLAFAQTNATSPSTGPNAFIVPIGGYTGNAGDVTTINWTPTTSGTVTIVLRSGASSNLIAGTVVASSIPNSGSFAWTVPSDITRGTDYALEIVDDADPTINNFTPQFVIESPNTIASITNPVTLGTATGSASASGSASSAAATGSSTGSAASASTTGSATGSSSGSASGSATMSTSASRSSGASATASGAVLTTSSAAGAARATAMAGMLGVVALGALAL